MYLFTILSALICIQLITIASTNAIDMSSNDQVKLLHQLETSFDPDDISTNNSESDEENNYNRRAASFLRFGRQIAPSSGSFLRFGRSNPSFSRLNRASHKGGAFLRFGRRGQQSNPNNFLRLNRKGDFLRFG
ncbi:unnamed protein product [Rotaria sordida]|uniref:Uncharacterized protein n=2 Tax=Rotaria sordida TaxID=392033 RepID=A0A813Y7Q2_9BILA|nr:unnamed protein product [Rotaria sordida]CAF0879376.1 unnamed protein product [Rotaria sordida]CAF0886315.1 unnamed protein product [Rotaria sordida]CAF0898255.1 unnamed protein product [Rotaria sordida]CAF0906048.1 unnamed protein product [Rotaria sordida]